MDKKLKIAIIGSRGYPYVYSGYETLVKELSERLIKKGHKVRVYCHSSLFKKKPREVNGIELVYTPSIETKFLSQFVNSFFSFIHVCFSKVDVVLVLNSANGPFGILTKIFFKNTCINVDGLEWLRPKWKGLGSFYFKISSKLSTIFFDQIITDSYEMNKLYKNKYSKNSFEIAYGSTMTDSTNINILKKYNTKKNQYYLIVGRLIPDNNSELIINGLLSSNSIKKIIIVGDVPYKDIYSQRVKSNVNKRIIFTGYVNSQDDLTYLYRNCYAYIHGHEFGGTNPTMINALHLNCAILALDTVFNSEMLKNKEAVLFKKDVNSIANSINLFEEKYNILLKKNINYKIPIKYNWDYIVSKYLEVFRLLTNHQNR